MSLLSDDLIGTELKSFTYETEATQIRLFAQALGLSDPVFRDREVARERGLDDVPAPPGLILFVSAQDSYAEVFDKVGLDYATDLSAELDLTFHRPVVAGEQLSGRTVVVGIDLKEGKRGTVQFVRLQTEYRDAAGDLALTELSSVAHIVTKEA
jgi:acyl dehydratase